MRNSRFTAAGLMVQIALILAIGAPLLTLWYAVLLRPLPYPHSSRIECLRGIVSYPQYARLAAQTQLGVWAFYKQDISAVTGPQFSLEANLTEVNRTFFRVLGIRAYRGHVFTPWRGGNDSRPMAVLSYHFWRRHYVRHDRTIGASLELHSQEYTISGILPRGENFTDADLYIPLRLKPAERGSLFATLNVLVRIAQPPRKWPAKKLQASLLRGLGDDAAFYSLQKLQNRIIHRMDGPLHMLVLAVLAVLLLGMINTVNLSASHTRGQTRQMSIRHVLGATRFRLFRQAGSNLFKMVVMGGCAGALLGVVILHWVTHSAQTGHIPRITEARLGPPFVIMALLLMLILIIFAATPVAYLTFYHLKKLERLRWDAMARPRNSSWFLVPVMTEIILATAIMLPAVGLCVSFFKLTHLPYGFNITHLRLLITQSPQSESVMKAEYARRTGKTLRGLPGVENASAATTAPFLFFDISAVTTQRRGFTRLTPTDISTVDDHYFATLQVPFLRGHNFQPFINTAVAARVAIVNQALAARLWGNLNPMGHQILWFHGANRIRSYRVIGEVQDFMQSGPRQLGSGYTNSFPARAEPILFLSLAQNPHRRLFIMVRAAGGNKSLNARLQHALLRLNPASPPIIFGGLQRRLAKFVALRKVSLWMAGLLSGLGIVLMTTGVYSMTAATLQARTRELAIRMALGATPRRMVHKELMRQTLTTVCGCLIGFIGGNWLLNILRSQLYGMRTHYFAAEMAEFIMLLAISLIAVLIPAAHAVHTDPHRLFAENYES